MSVTRSCCRFTALSGASVQAPGRGLSERPVCTRRPTPGPRPSPALKSARCPCPLGVTAGPVLCGVRAHGEGPVGFGSRHLGARRVYFGEEVHVHLWFLLLEFSGCSLEAAGSRGRGAWTQQQSGPAEPAPTPVPRGPVTPPLRPSLSSRGDPHVVPARCGVHYVTHGEGWVF